MSTSKPSASVPGDKEKLVDWRADPADMTLQNLDTWYLGGGTVHRVPTKKELAEKGIAALLEGFLPERPLQPRRGLKAALLLF